MITESPRTVRARAYFYFAGAFALVVFAAHLPYLTLPYFWDELGQFVPAALDILRDSAWVPRSTIPNVHPPGVMAYLALVWKVVGYSIPATRLAMLAFGALTVFFTFLLAIELCGHLKGAPAFFAVVLLLLDPLFYTQSMMAQLDMPAGLFTIMALLFFLQDRQWLASAACVALVLAKETGLLLPAIFLCVLIVQPARRKYAALYVLSPVAVAIWLLVLWRATGHIMGNAEFAHYNVGYALHPVRAALSVLRHFYFLFFADFRFIGAIALTYAFARTPIFRTWQWRMVAVFFVLHVLLVSVLGGAELERYVVPVLPLLYIGVAAAWTTLRPRLRIASAACLSAGLLLGFFLNPPYPFPFENNLAIADFVELHRSAAHVLEHTYPSAKIYTAWPLTAALRRPEFGYVSRPLRTEETSDFHPSSFTAIQPDDMDVLVTYSRTWEPTWGFLRLASVRAFLEKFYEYEPQITSDELRDRFGLLPVARWTQRGQWIEIYAKPHGRGLTPATPRRYSGFGQPPRAAPRVPIV